MGAATPMGRRIYMGVNYEGRAKIVSYLVEKGANINCKNNVSVVDIIILNYHNLY